MTADLLRQPVLVRRLGIVSLIADDEVLADISGSAMASSSET